MPFVDASLPLHKAVYDHLKADAGVNAIVAGRVYDGVPGDAIKPYVALGPFQVIPERGDCLDGGEIFVTLDAYAAGPKTTEIKQLGAAVIAALDEVSLTLTGNRLVLLELEQANYLRDADGITVHASITMRAATDPL